MEWHGNPSTDAVKAAMRSGWPMAIDSPNQRQHPPDGVPYVLDNSRYGARPPSPDAWWAWLSRHRADKGLCRLATAPDVVGDARATLDLSLPWLDRIRAAGYPAALVAQNGLEDMAVPWGEFDVLFLGGSVQWKLSQAAYDLTQQALEQGKRVHMGKVNTWRRLELATRWGVHSSDGTCLAQFPDAYLPRVLSWSEQLAALDRLLTRHAALDLRGGVR